MADVAQCRRISTASLSAVLARNRLSPGFALIPAITHYNFAAVNRITDELPDSAHGMGELQRATDIKLKRACAIKILPDAFQDPN